MKLIITALLLVTGTCIPVCAQSVDPLESPLWDHMRQQFIGNDDFIFDNRVIVTVPEFAEDPTQVPVTVDAESLNGNIIKIVAWADLNPIQHIFTYFPHKDIVPRISLRIKIQQGTAIRAAVLTNSGVWHIGGSYLDAAGGGCTTPSGSTSNPYWEKHLGEMKTKFFPRQSGGRYKLKIIHPMDTGLVTSIPEFYIEELIVKSESGQPTARMQLFPPVSENPVITFDVRNPDQKHTIWMRDNGGNLFEQAL